MKKQTIKKPTNEDAWDVVADTPEEAANLRLRSIMIVELKQYIRKKNWTQTEAAEHLGVTQPRISDLFRGKIDVFGLESLVNMSVAAGLRVELRVLEAA